MPDKPATLIAHRTFAAHLTTPVVWRRCGKPNTANPLGKPIRGIVQKFVDGGAATPPIRYTTTRTLFAWSPLSVLTIS